MIIELSRHLFGADRGYRTLAESTDVTTDERRELETFTFGQTDDPTYVDALEHDPSYWSRPLSSGRRAITRAMRGERDEQGRPTLRLMTVIVSTSDWLAVLCGEESSLLAVNEVWSWDGGKELSRLRVRIEKRRASVPTIEERQRVLSLLGAVETNAGDQRATVVATEIDLAPKEIELLAALLPAAHKADFSYAVRSLSDGLPVQVNCLAACASRGKSRRGVVQWTPDVKYDGWRYTSALAHFWKPGESPPWEFVANCKSFGEISLLAADIAGGNEETSVLSKQRWRPNESAQRRSSRFPMYWLLALVLVVAVSTTGFIVWQKVAARHELESLIAQGERFLLKNPDPGALTSDACQPGHALEAGVTLAQAIAGLESARSDERLNRVKNSLGEWRAQAEERCADYRRLDRVLTNFSAICEGVALGDGQRIQVYPTPATFAAIESWKEKLREARQMADRLDTAQQERVEAALQRVSAWDVGVSELLIHLEETTAELEEYFGAEVPSDMSDGQRREYRDRTELLDKVGAAVATGGDEVPESVVQLRERIAACEANAVRWRHQVARLQATFDMAVADAQRIIEQERLYYGPVDTGALMKSWSQAALARSALSKALEVYPEDSGALQAMNTVESWMEKAEESAFSYFKAKVEWAMDGLDAPIATTQETEPESPQGHGAGVASRLRLIEAASAYWAENERLILNHDEATARKLFRQMSDLHTELLKDAQPATPDPDGTEPTDGNAGGRGHPAAENP